MIPPRIVLATANPGKSAELRALVAEWGEIEVLGLDTVPDVVLGPETGASYAENAVAKACRVARAAGLPALADDSGLEVEALGGAPGVRSARYAGEDASDRDRVATLLRALEGVPPERRRARFCCVVALAWPDGRVETAEGACTGTIATRPEGVRGFGYDPIFVDDEVGRSFATFTADEKRRVSHRARAMRSLGQCLRTRTSPTLRGPGSPC